MVASVLHQILGMHHAHTWRSTRSNDEGKNRSYGDVNATSGAAVHAGDHIETTVVNVNRAATNQNINMRSTLKYLEEIGFVGREEEMKKLTHMFSKGNPCRRVGLVGLSGIGKSMIAIQYAHDFLRSDPSNWVFWVDAGSITGFTRSFQEIAEKVGLQQRSGPRANILQIVANWLHETGDSWLLILDGVDFEYAPATGPSMESGNSEYARMLECCAPQSKNGFVLVTSCNLVTVNSMVRNPTCVIQVDQMSSDIAMMLWKSRYNLGQNDDQIAEQLLRTLNYIPLAITQAAAYFADKCGVVTLSDYLGYLHDAEYQPLVLQEAFADINRGKISHNSVLNTWSISFIRIAKNHPKAAELLALMSLLDNSNIPEELIIGCSAERYAYQTEHIPILLQFSLIKIGKADSFGKKTYEIHSLVQIATRAWLEKKGELSHWKAEALRRVQVAFPDAENQHCDWKLCATLFPHVCNVLALDLPQECDLERADLLCKAACYRRHKGDYQSAADSCKTSLLIRENSLGMGDVKTLRTRKEMAHIYRDLERWADAERELKLVLEGGMKIEPDMKREMLDSRSLLGELSVLQGRYVEGQQKLEEVLEEQRHCLGLYDQHTLLTTRKLGLAFLSQKMYDEARKHLEFAWYHQKATPSIGPEHLNTIRTGVLLGDLYYQRGSSWGMAVDVFRQVLEASTNALGTQHSETKMVKEKLLKAQSKFESARKAGSVR